MWPDPEKVQTLSAQIGWSHHQVLLDAYREDPDLYSWYAAKTVANRWPVRQLQAQIHLRLHERHYQRHSYDPRVLTQPDTGKYRQRPSHPAEGD